MSICRSISWATAVYGTFKQNIYEDETRLCFINYVLLPAPLLFLRAQRMFRPLLHWTNTLSFLNQVFSFWCQEIFVFSVFASSPPSDSITLQLGIYFYHNTENVSQRLLMKADFMVKSNSFLSLCLLLPCYHLYYLPLCSLLEILLSWRVRGLIPACTSIPFFFNLFRGLLSSCHFLVLC